MSTPVDAEFEDDKSERERNVLIEKIAKVLQKIVDALPDTPGSNENQALFACKEPPRVSFCDFLKRFVVYGQLPTNLLLAGLMFTDRALRTREFTQKSVVHK